MKLFGEEFGCIPPFKKLKVKMFEKLIGTLKWFDITYAMVRPFDQNNLACNVYDDIINEFLYVYE